MKHEAKDESWTPGLNLGELLRRLDRENKSLDNNHPEHPVTGQERSAVVLSPLSRISTNGLPGGSGVPPRSH